MGGQSYSYVYYDSNGYGLFNGTANDDGGGFSNVKMRGDYSYDLSEYDGIVIDVASQDSRTYKFDLEDSTWRFWSVGWHALFEVEGGMNQQTIYIPFSNFNPRWLGITMWPYSYSLF